MKSTCAAVVVVILAAAPAVQAQQSAVAGLQANARDGASRVSLGRALRRAGRFDEALRALALVRDPANRPAAVRETARVRADQGNFRAMEAVCRQLPATSVERHVCTARAFLVWNRVTPAEREIAAAQSMSPNDPELALVLGDARRLGSDLTAAETHYLRATQGLSGRDEPWIGLGTLHEMMQRPDDALTDYRRAVEVDPSDPMAALMLGQFLVRRRNNPTEALPLLQRAVNDRPGWALALESLGEAQLGMNSFTEALASFQQAARISPTQPGAQTGIGRALIGLNRHREAEAPLRLAITQVGNDARAFMALADVLEHTGREPEAATTWDQAIDRAPHEPTPRMRAAELAHRMHQNAMARAELDELLTTDATYAPALLLRGDIEAEDGRRNEARQFYNQAMAGHDGAVARDEIQRRISELDQPVRVRRH